MANKFFKDYYKTVVVLANDKTVVNDKFAKKEVKQQVIRADQLINYLKSLKTEMGTSFKSMKESGERVFAMNVQERTDYFKKFEELVAEVQNDFSVDENTIEENADVEADDKLVCPRCGGQLVLRTAKKGDNAGNQFVNGKPSVPF